MEFILHPWHFLVLVLSALINREQEKVVEYLQAGNEVLSEKLGKGRILLNYDWRRRLAPKDKVLERKVMLDIATLLTQDTILRWHRARRGSRRLRPDISRNESPRRVIASQNPRSGF